VLVQFLAGGCVIERRVRKTRSELCSDQISPKLEGLYMTLSILKKEGDWVEKWGEFFVLLVIKFILINYFTV